MCTSDIYSEDNLSLFLAWLEHGTVNVDNKVRVLQHCHLVNHSSAFPAEPILITLAGAKHELKRPAQDARIYAEAISSALSPRSGFPSMQSADRTKATTVSLPGEHEPDHDPSVTSRYQPSHLATARPLFVE